MRELSACALTRYERAEGVWGVSLHYRGEKLKRVAPQTKRIYEIEQRNGCSSARQRGWSIAQNAGREAVDCQIGEANKCIVKRLGENY